MDFLPPRFDTILCTLAGIPAGVRASSVEQRQPWWSPCGLLRKMETLAVCDHFEWIKMFCCRPIFMLLIVWMYFWLPKWLLSAKFIAGLWTTKVRASVGPTAILPVRVRGPALILKIGYVSYKRKTRFLRNTNGVSGSAAMEWFRLAKQLTRASIMRVQYLHVKITWWPIRTSRTDLP